MPPLLQIKPSPTNQSRRSLLRFFAVLPALLIELSRGIKALAGRPAHYAPDGTFRNSNGVAINKKFSELMRWRREAPKVKLLSFPLSENNPAYLQQNRSEATLTWIGHCTLLLQLNGLNILTDPHFSKRASPVSFSGPKRGTPPGLNLEQLPPIDIVLISHNHYDHFDNASIKYLAQRDQPQFIVPLKLAAAVARLGSRTIHELDWQDALTINGIKIVAEPSHHWSARGLFDRNETLWANYVIQHEQFRFLFIGDTGYSDDYAALGEKYGGFELAAIPIGAYAPRWFMKQAHINPEEAVKIFHDVNARQAVGIHWGVFPLTNEAMDEPPRRLANACAAQGIGEKQFTAWQHGESRYITSFEGIV